MWSDGSHLLACNMRGQAWPRHSPSSADLSGRLKSSHPFAVHLCCASCTSPRGLTSCFQVPTYIHADVPPGWRMSLFFSKRNVSFYSIPLPPSCIFELQLFSGSLPLQFLPLFRLFMETGEQGGGMKFREVDCAVSLKLFLSVYSSLFLLEPSLWQSGLEGIPEKALRAPQATSSRAEQGQCMCCSLFFLSAATIIALLLLWVSPTGQEVVGGQTVFWELWNTCVAWVLMYLKVNCVQRGARIQLFGSLVAEVAEAGGGQSLGAPVQPQPLLAPQSFWVPLHGREQLTSHILSA